MAAIEQTQYFESRVLTAPPHRLHLMLIEGALRFGRQAENFLQRGDTMAASSPLLRVVDIVGELLVGVRAGSSEVSTKLTEFYTFLFRTVTAAKINDDREKLAVVLKLLEFERQTWQLVCDKLPAEAIAAEPRQVAPGASASRPIAAPYHFHGGTSAPTTGVSWQA